MATLELTNLHNSCFVNVILQVLYSNPDFRYFICKKIYVETDKNQPVCNALYYLFSRAGIESNAEDLRNVLERYYFHSRFNDGTQNDSGEFFLALYDSIKKEISPGNFSGQYVLSQFEFTLRRTHLYINDSLICPVCAETLVPFQKDEVHAAFDVPLPGGRQDSWSLQQLIDRETSGGDQVNDRECPNSECKANVYRYKDLAEFRIFPKYLILNLKRTIWSMTGIAKNNSYVKFSDLLRVNNADYKLCSIVDHLGATPNSGHWIMHLAVNESNTFTTCNDKIITKNKSVHEIMSRNNTLFVYVKIEEPDILVQLGNPTVKSSDNLNVNLKRKILSEESKSEERKDEKYARVSGLQDKEYDMNINIKKEKGKENDKKNKSSTICKGCNKSFVKINAHLSQKPACKSIYADPDFLQNEKKKKPTEITVSTPMKFNTEKKIAKADKTKEFPKSVKKGDFQSIEKDTKVAKENSLLCESKQMVGLSDTECRGCNKSFGRLLGHISRNKICKSFYTDAEILEKQKEKKRIQKQELRQNKSDNEKGKEKEEDRQRKKIV